MNAAEHAYRDLVRAFGIGFDPDNRAEDIFPPLDCPRKYERVIEAAMAAGVDIYKVAVEVFEEEKWI